MLPKNDFIVPIPGSRKLERIQENRGAADVDLGRGVRTDRSRAGEDQDPRNRTDEDIAKLRETT